MNTKLCHLTIGVGLMLWGTGIFSRADAAEIPIKGTFSGTYVNTQIDTNNDGLKAALAILGAKGTFGPSTIQGVNEIVFSGPATCPNGNAGVGFTLLRPQLPAAPTNFVQRFESTGDLLFSEQTSLTLCFDLTTQIQFASGTANFTGGTGRFEGATGTFTFEATLRTLFEDAVGNFFGEQSGTTEGTLILPTGRDQDHPKGRD